MPTAAGDSRQLEDKMVIYVATTVGKASEARRYEGDLGGAQKSQLHSLLQQPEDRATGTLCLQQGENTGRVIQRSPGPRLTFLNTTTLQQIKKS